MIDFNNYTNSFVCKCGKTHSVNTNVLFGENKLNLLKTESKKILKAGHILFIYDNNVIDTDKDDIVALFDKDYLITVKKLNDELNVADKYNVILEDVKVAEDVRLVVAVGGEKAIDTAKIIGIEYVFIPTVIGNCYCDSKIYLLKENTLKAENCLPPSLLLVDFDLISKNKKRNNMAYAYSIIMSSRILFAETLFSFLKGDEVCPFLFDEMKETVKEEFSVTFFENSFLFELFEKIIKLSIYREMNSLFIKDASLLFSKVLGLFNETLNEYSYVIAYVYLNEHYLNRIDAPYDYPLVSISRENVILRFTELFHIDYDNYLLNVKNVEPEEIMYANFVLKGIVQPMREVLQNKKEVSASVSYFKRLLTDGGYKMKNVLLNDYEDVILFTAELIECGSFLKLIYLEGYVSE